MSIQAHVHETGPVRAHVHADDAPDAHVGTPVIERLIPGPPGPGLPPGGTPGQIIKKSGLEDYETDWYDYPSIAPGTHSSGTAVIGGVLDENEASGNYSLSFGRGNTATKGGSLAFGRNNSATGSYSAAVGYGNTASAVSAHAEGDSTTASGQMAHSEGQGTTASGQDSHAEGYFTTASGELSHSEGRETTASGRSSHAEGQYTIAKHRSQHAFGEYNVADPSAAGPTAKGNYIEIVGNGTADNARSNARTLDWGGNEVIAGKLTMGAAPSGNMDAATKGYVDTEISSLDAEDVGLTVITALEIAAILQS